MIKDRRWLYIAIISFFLAAIWAGALAFAKLKSPVIPTDLEKIAKPLDPNIDRSVLLNLQRRKGEINL